MQNDVRDGSITAAEERIGDAERSAACDALSEHFAAGRLDPAELDQRLNLAVHAVTGTELRQLTADLPAAPVAAPAQPPAATNGWPVMSVLALVGLIGSLVIAGGMLLVLGLVSAVLFVGALVGGLAAAVGGASACYLLMNHVRWRRPGEE